jgi:hypothetical protein
MGKKRIKLRTRVAGLEQNARAIGPPMSKEEIVIHGLPRRVKALKAWVRSLDDGHAGWLKDLEQRVSVIEKRYDPDDLDGQRTDIQIEDLQRRVKALEK